MENWRARRRRFFPFHRCSWITLREWDLARERKLFSVVSCFRGKKAGKKAYKVGMERKGSRRNRDDITGNNDNRDDNRIIGSDPAWTMCYSSFRGVRTRDRRWKGVGKRRGSGRWSFKLRRRNRWNEIEMHSPRSRPLRRPPGLFPVYSSRSLLKEEGRWARKERRDVEEKEKENLHQQTADSQLPYKYINI